MSETNSENFTFPYHFETNMQSDPFDLINKESNQNEQQNFELESMELYFLKNPTYKTTKENTRSNIEKKILFITAENNKNMSGRKRKRYEKSNRDRSRNRSDNILSKVEVSYNNFINKYINHLIDELDEFRKIKGRFKKISYIKEKYN